MTLKISCTNPNCDAVYSVDEAKLGKTLACKKCGKEFTLSTEKPTVDDQASLETHGDEQVKPDPNKKVKKIGRFEIIEKIGQGAFGEVYRAHDSVLDREVALKVPHRSSLQNERAKARFLREPKAAARLQHQYNRN